MFDQPTTMNVQQRLVNSFFRIPRYQRPYVWNQDNIDHLINDIDESDQGYFIGTAIFYKSSESDDTFEIVDGQQRITTISLIISVLADLYRHKEINKSSYAESNLQTLLEGKVWRDSENLHSKIRLEKSASDLGTQNFFAQEILKVDIPGAASRIEFNAREISKEGKHLQKMRKHISDTLAKKFGIGSSSVTPKQKSDDLEDFKNKLLEAKMLTISATDFSEAYTIFKTLNSTGQDLNLDDLIKSSLLEKIPESAGIDGAKEKWNIISNNLEAAKSVAPRLNIDDFFYNSWISRGRESHKKSSFFSEFDSALTMENAPEIMNDFHEDAKIYELIFAGREDYNGKAKNVDQAINNLRRFGVTQYAPFVLLLVRYYLKNQKGVDKSIITKTLSMLEKFHFSYNAVTKSPGNRITKIYPRMTQRILASRNKSDINSVLKDLHSELMVLQPSEANFIENFENITYFNEKNISENNRRLNDIARYSLEKIYSSERFSSFGQSLKSLTIEHLVPQSLGGRRKNNRNRYIGTLGNLIFLTERDNGNIGNSSIEEKKSYFEENSLSVPDFVFNDDFTPESIGQRNIDYAKSSYENIWKLTADDTTW